MVPADLTAVIVITALVNVAVFAPLVRATPMRPLLGIGFLLSVPGYTFLATVFPEAGGSDPDAGGGAGTGTETGSFDSRERATPRDTTALARPSGGSLTGIERAALSCGTSVVIVPVLVLGLNVTPWKISLVSIMLAVTGFVLASTAVAAVRRWHLPPEQRFRVPYRELLSTDHRPSFDARSRSGVVLNVLLIASLVLVVGIASVGVLVPSDGEQFSAVSVLTETEDGGLVAGGHSTELELGESHELVVGVDNEESRTVEYTVVVVEQRLERTGPDDDLIVAEQRELERFEPELAHGETWRQHHDISPTMTGGVRVAWLLYPDAVPDEPSLENTEYRTSLRFDVTENDE